MMLGMLKGLIFQKKKEKVTQFFQNIFIEFKNGKVIMSSVPAFVSTQKEFENWEIKAIRITEPKELPDGCWFND